MTPLVSVFQHLRQSLGARSQPWLIVGKGPSADRLSELPLRNFRVFTLNDAVRAVPRADIAHFIDLDALERCAGALGATRLVVMPWFPHVGHQPGRHHLDALSRRHPVLAQLRTEQRLGWYDLASAPQRHGDAPVVHATFFSAEAALDLLATAGVRTVRSIGVDGGADYAQTFADLRGVSRLANGQTGFDRQFESFAAVIQRTGVDYSPLGVAAPVRVFVAATASERLPLQVLAFSIRRHASASVRITPLGDLDIPIPVPRAPQHRPRTPFSFQRFLIPQACAYAGRALYLDADMLVLRDLLPLWRHPFGAAPVLTVAPAAGSGRQAQCSVMLMDCARLRWTVADLVAALDAGRLDYESLMHRFAPAPTQACLAPEWNCLERYTPHRTALLHYTDMHRQPWVSCANPLAYLWVRALREAIAQGAIARDLVAQEVALGHVRPSLLAQIDGSEDDPLLLPAAVRALDRGFVAPLRALAPHGGSPWNGRLLWLRAALRSRYQATWLHALEWRLRRRWSHRLGPS